MHRMEEIMREKNLLQEFLRYVALNVCGMLGLSGYILADTFFIANGLGADGLTALNLAIPVYSFVHGCGLMLGMGGATKFSIYQGQGNGSYADKAFTSSFCIGAAFAAVFLCCGIFFSEGITALLGADQAVFAMTQVYLKIILLFSPMFIANDLLLCFVRNDGNPKLAMAAMLSGSFANILLDYLLIFPMHMGILGAVLATGFAPIISISLLSEHWRRKQNHFHFARRSLSLRLTAGLVSLGFPSLITEVASGISIIIFNLIILNLEGNLGVAAYGIVANLSLVVTAVYTGIAQGIQPITSRAYGYGDKNGIRKILSYAIVLTLGLSVGIYALFFLASGSVAELFNREKNPLLQQIAIHGLKLYFTAVPFVGVNIILSTYFTSTEKALPAQVISLSRGFFLIIPLAFLLSFFFQMNGVWLSYPITEGIAALMGIVLYRSAVKTKSVQRP